MSKTIRLTMAQALTRFSASQMTVIDGQQSSDLRQASGRSSVTAMSPASARRFSGARRTADLSRPQRTGDGACGDRVCQGYFPPPRRHRRRRRPAVRSGGALPRHLRSGARQHPSWRCSTASRSWTPPRAGSAAARSPSPPPATSPPRTSSGCCTGSAAGDAGLDLPALVATSVWLSRADGTPQPRPRGPRPGLRPGRRLSAVRGAAARTEGVA